MVSKIIYTFALICYYLAISDVCEVLSERSMLCLSKQVNPDVVFEMGISLGQTADDIAILEDKYGYGNRRVAFYLLNTTVKSLGNQASTATLISEILRCLDDEQCGRLADILDQCHTENRCLNSKDFRS